MFGRKRQRQSRVAAWMGRLTLLAIAADFFATMSYSTGAHVLLRRVDPAWGSWWNGHEFAIVELAATALGLLAGIRFGAALTGAGDFKSRPVVNATVAAALLLVPASRLAARIARFHFAGGAATRETIIDRFGYDTGMFLDKLLTGCVYSIKMSAFSLLLGMILFGLAVAILMTTGSDASPAQANSN